MKTGVLVAELSRLHKRISTLEDYVKKIKAENFKDQSGLIDNKKTISNVFGKELGRSIRYNRSLSIISITIENLDEIRKIGKNGVADQLMLVCGEKIIKSVRKTDTPCKYGFNQFVIILPEVMLGLAKRVAVRVMKEVGLHLAPVFECNTNVKREFGKIKISCKVAEYRDEVTIDELLENAKKL